MSRFKKILVPVDFSEHSTAAVEPAIDLARAFGSKLHLLHCYPIQPGGLSPYEIAIPSNYFTEIRDAASQQLSDWQEKHVLLGSVAERTVQLAPCPVMTVHAPRSNQADGDD